VSDKSFSAEEIDTSKAHPARMYDFYLGGLDNYEVDREAAQRVVEAIPDAVPTARGNRAFLGRAVRFIAGQGISQFLDVGTGIPTSPNTHELARAVVPDARVAYVDNDPIVAAHAGARLTNTPGTGFFLGDLRDARSILDHPTLRELIDFGKPVGLMLIAVTHFVTDDEGAYEAVATLTEALPPGSCMALSHVTTDFYDKEFWPKVQEAYSRATAPLLARTQDEVGRFFEGFDLAEPGVVHLPRWRPDGPETQEWSQVHLYGAVGVKR
jgi:S-adenosyl methyltransferase